MPEFLASLFGAAAPSLLEAGGEALLPTALEAGGEAALSGGLGSFGELASAGLPFAAGAGELGSVATGLGPAGVSAFGDSAGLLAALGAGGAGALPAAAETVAAGLPFAAGAGEVGANAGGAGVDLSALLAGTGDASIPANASLTSGGPMSFGGVTSVGPTSGTPAAALGNASFDTAPAVAGGPTGAAPLSAGGAASVAAPAGSAPIDLTSMLSKAVGKIGENPLGLALAAGGLGYNIFKGQQDTDATKRIQGQDAGVAANASQLLNEGKGLAAHTEAGTLPPAIQQQLDQSTKDAKTKMISTYASNGMNTDPNKNSMLRQELEGIDKRALATKGELQKQLLASGATLINSGTALVGADNDLIKTLSNIDQKSTERIGSAIANFASALSGKSGSGITLNLGKGP